MLLTALGMIGGVLAASWGFFFKLLEPMMPDNQGAVFFFSVILPLFTTYKFIDLFLGNFVSSAPGDSSQTRWYK